MLRKSIFITIILMMILIMGNVYATEGRVSQEELFQNDSNIENIEVNRENAIMLLSGSEEVTILATWDISATQKDNVTAVLYSNGRLIISGTGNMKSFGNSNDVIWHEYQEDIVSAYVEEGITKIGMYAFLGCSNLESIDISEGVTLIEYGAFKDCSKLKNIIMPQGLNKIESSAFKNCSSLINIEIPNSVTELSSSTFDSCNNLESVKLSDKLTRIANRTFYLCSNLNSIKIPDSVKFIGEDAFRGCESLENVELPEGLLEIGGSAFCTCRNIRESITIPKSVTSIGKNAFFGCNKLSIINVYCNSYIEECITENDTDKINVIHGIYEEKEIAATCTEQGYTIHICTECNDSYIDTYTEAKGHSYGEWNITKKATCTEPGLKERACNICKNKDFGTIEALGHNYSEEWTIDVEPTCREEGNKSHHCTRENCNAKSDITEVPVAAHSFGAWIIDKDPTYEEKGHKYRVCTNCNNEREEQVIPVLTKEELQVTTIYTVKEKDNQKYVVISSISDVQEILSNITSNKDLEIVDKSGNILGETIKVGTGAKVLEKQTKEVVYTIVVKGDADGDAKIDFIKDIIRFNNYRLNIIKLDTASIFAGDANEDGKIDFVKDIIRINNYRLGLINSL